VDEVERMTAELYGHGADRRPPLKEFDVPRQDISLILDKLAGASKDHWPAKWVVMGELKLSCKDGREFELHLYYTFRGSGAFSVGPYPKQKYYRGSTDSDFENAIRKAHDDLKNQK
jgi:hypothetical protein